MMRTPPYIAAFPLSSPGVITSEELSSEVDSVLPLLMSLLAHPAFVKGVQDCQEYFLDAFEEAPLTDEEMLCEVEENLGRRAMHVDQASVTLLGGRVPPYLEYLGWVIGTIARGLSYPQDTSNE